MTKKDYVAIAELFQVTKPTVETLPKLEQWYFDLFRLTDYLEQENKRFDRKQFLVAAGGWIG